MKKLNAIFLIPLIAMAACTEPVANRSKEEKAEDSLKKVALEPVKEYKEKAYYPIPSPEQMFGFINDAGVQYNKSLIHDFSVAENYNDPVSKSLNFGIYTADLAYAAAYQDIETTIDLYKVVKRMGADLNIEKMMTEEMLAQVQANLQNPDSLAVIAGRSYYEAVDYLERNGQQGKLALMSLGGWVESLYITLNAIEKFDPSSETAQRIADQKITFGNLYTFLKKNEEKNGVSGAIESIQGVRAVFASLKEEKVARSDGSAKNGKMVLSSSKSISINENQFNKLKEAINEYRIALTSAS